MNIYSINNELNFQLDEMCDVVKNVKKQYDDIKKDYELLKEQSDKLKIINYSANQNIIELENRLKYTNTSSNIPKQITSPQNEIIGKKPWPNMYENCSYKGHIGRDFCSRIRSSVANDPFYASDYIDGYTNNGFYKAWGGEINRPGNVNYVTVTSTEDISNVLKQLDQKTKIIVKNTGHDYIGRSYPDENVLVIWTHLMSDVCWHPKTTETGAPHSPLVAKNKFQKVVQNKLIGRPNLLEIMKKNIGSAENIKDFENVCDQIEKYTKMCPSDANNIHGYYTASAGVQWYKVFDYMNRTTDSSGNVNVWALKGGSNTVGATGGWILDGGFGLFTKLFGMGIDNVLCMTVVLANGNIKTISNCDNTDLFFAFRGGGACNFGIVSSVTYKLYPALTHYGDFFCHLEASNKNEFLSILEKLFKSEIMINKYLGGAMQLWADYKIDLFISYANISQDYANVNIFNKFIDEIMSLGGGITYGVNKDKSKDSYSFFMETKGNNKNYAIISEQHNNTLSDTTTKFYTPSSRWWTYESYDDYIVGFGSKFLLIDDVKKPKECANKFLQILESGANMIQIEISKGMYGASDDIMKENAKSAVHPEIRRSVGLVYIRSYLEHFCPSIDQSFDELGKVRFKYESDKALGKSLSEIYEDIKGQNLLFEKTKINSYKEKLFEYAEMSSNRIKKAVDTMRSLLIGEASYINHSDCNEPDFQNHFWGADNYKKLQTLKLKYDPNDIFHHRYSIELPKQTI